MAADSTEKWIRFFSKAGIPSRAATTYALTFADNRIQMDMLLDLNKEYLRDMGITLMGDVIAILRHARQVHEEITHEKLLCYKTPISGPSENPPTSLKVSVSSAVSLPSKSTKTLKSVAATTLKNPSSSLNSSSRSPSGSPPTPPSRPTKRTMDNSVREAVQKNSNFVPTPLSVSTGVVEKGVPARLGVTTEAVKRKSAEISRENQAKAIIIDNDVPSPPMKKVRRVLPEHEGGYKIKMPSGSTPRSQQILAKQKEMVNKKTVFDRLGRSSPVTELPSTAVSSTTSDPIFAVTGLGSESSLKKKSVSVFSRLGDKQVSSTSTIPSSRTDSITLSSPSMVADSVSSPVRNELRGRLGSSTQTTSLKSFGSVPQLGTTKTAGILAGPSIQSNRGVKTRLGDNRPLSRVQQASDRKQSPTLKQRISPPTQATGLTSKRIKLNSVNGSSAQPVKKVSFATNSRTVSTKAGVFSRLGR